MTVRNTVPITVRDWRDQLLLPPLKVTIWEEVKETFDVDEIRKCWTLKEAGRLHRRFRTKLRKIARDGEGKLSSKPPPQWVELSMVISFWDDFVKQSQDEDFQVESTKNRDSAKSIDARYRGGSIGYADIEHNIRKEKIAKGENPIVTRMEKWEEGRKRKGTEDVFDPKVREIIEESESIKQTMTPEELNFVGPNDLLSKVLKGPEYGGRVRGFGFGITKKTVFDACRTSSEASQINHLTNLVMNLTQEVSKLKNERSERNDQLNHPNLNPIVESSHDDSTPLNRQVPSEGEDCYLLLESPLREVGKGQVFGSPGGILHNLPLPSSYVKVKIDMVHDIHHEDCLPHPIAIDDQVTTLGAAIGYFVGWPLKLLSLVPLEKRRSSMGESVQESTSVVPECPPVNNVDDIACWDFIEFAANNMKDDTSIPIHMSSVHFVDTFDDEISKENIREVINCEWLSASSLCLYMRYLCDTHLNDENVKERFSFITPHASQCMIRSIRTSSQHIARANKEASEFIAKSINRHRGKDHLIMFPYNIGKHWVLVAINVANETIYYMDSVVATHSDVTRVAMKSVIDHAMSLYRMKQGVTSSKALRGHTWMDIKCPKQDNNNDCGYYVGLYMNDILLYGHTRIPVDIFSTRRKYTYSYREVERFRHRWAGYLWNEFLKVGARK